MDWLNAPPPTREKFAPVPIVSVPEFAIATAPPLAVETAPLNVKEVPVKLIPELPLVVTEEENVLVPVPAI